MAKRLRCGPVIYARYGGDGVVARLRRELILGRPGERRDPSPLAPEFTKGVHSTAETKVRTVWVPAFRRDDEGVAPSPYFANRYAPPFSTLRWNAGRACIRDNQALKFRYGASLSNTFAISPTKLIWISAPVSELPTRNSRPFSAPST